MLVPRGADDREQLQRTEPASRLNKTLYINCVCAACPQPKVLFQRRVRKSGSPGEPLGNAQPYRKRAYGMVHAHQRGGESRDKPSFARSDWLSLQRTPSVENHPVRSPISSLAKEPSAEQRARMADSASAARAYDGFASSLLPAALSV
jgi:hypothetical protein